MVPPKDAPNILLIMTDDAGFGIPSTFGGLIPTPSMDRIAAAWKMQHPRYFHARVALRAGKCHRERALNRIRRQTKIFMAANKLAMQIDTELVGCAGGEIEIGRAQ